ncbi:MAG: nucleotidyltransferase family protein [Desulfobacteraceae bacterium]|nr:MAG: nucleotidyltransferase family protein [Desulfobacteraceae bacterium]
MNRGRKGLREAVAGIVLAAGASSRMGSPKQLLGFGKTTLLGRVLNEALSSELDSVVVVLGYMAEEIAASLEDLASNPRLSVLLNKDYEKGLSSSIKAGLAFVERDYDHVMILLADMPFISRSIINRLISNYMVSGLPLGAVNAGGRRSHPVILSRCLYPEIARLEGDKGARGIFAFYKDRVCMVDTDTPFEDRDIDTPSEYEALIKVATD